ncbi:transporter substrate-binding domain-containing protein [Nostoc sp.]|uniref:transporter substrate-binding domain-containing protein n=1 Tax=Nostoc sp. TaxID=1180 RepID=UPI002FF857C5
MLLDKVIQHGVVKVGINSFAPGFSVATTDGSYTGFDIDWSRSLAAALFGDANKVEFVPLDFSKGFDVVTNSLVNGEVDVIAAPTTVRNTWDTNLKVDFSPINLYTSQQILVKGDRNINDIFDLKGLTIGTTKGTNAGKNLVSFFNSQGIDFTLREYEPGQLIEAYAKGEIDAASSDGTLLYSSLQLLSDPKNNKILDTEISKEPLAVTIPENDSEWADVVKWVTYAPIQAEEFGITKENINKFLADKTNPAINRFLGLEDNLGEKLGLKNDFVTSIIKQVGNYGEIYNRNFPSLERDRNYLWTDDGLLYSPPFAGTLPDSLTLNNNDNRNLLQEIKERGKVKLGVTGDSPGFAKQLNGEWQGFDIELGKAVAAAVFGDSSKLEIVVQNFSQGFDDVANGAIDIFAAGITNNLVRDAAQGVDFSPTYLYTGQDFLVRKDSGISFISDLNGRTIGLTSSTSGLQNIQDYLAEFGGSFIPLIFDTKAEMVDAYNRGEIDAISTDQTLIAGLIPTLSNPDDHKLLNNVISKEPLALAIDENQSAWGDLVRWVIYSLVQAEEFEISSKNIENLVAINTDNNPANDSSDEIRTFLGIGSNIGTGLGVSNDFVVNLIKAVGNYGEIYERNFDISILGRDENELYTDYGLQYSPPFAATVIPIIAATVKLKNIVTSLAENTVISKGFKVADIVIDKDGLGKENLSLKGADIDLFEIRGKELFIKPGSVLDFETNPQLDVIVEVDDPALENEVKSSASISISITDINEFPPVPPTPPTPPTLSLTKSEEGNNLLRFNGNFSSAKLEIALTSKDIGKGNIHEVALFVVDDTQGRVNGLLPSDPGYLQAVLSRSQTIFSVIPDGFVPNPTRNLEHFSGSLLSFYLVQNGTTDEVLRNPAAQGKVLFGNTNNALQITGLGSNQFQLSFEDQLGDSAPDLTLNVRLTETAPPLGSKLQGKVERELIDLTGLNDQSIQAIFTIVKSEAAYNNTVGFYRVENEQGTVLDPLTGQLLNPGDNDYTQAALRSASSNGMSCKRQSEGMSNILQGGSIFATFIITNGTMDQMLDKDMKNDVPVYFNYIGANSDGVDHVRLLGNNTWGFEDLAGGGDRDFNDMVIQAKFQVVSKV